MSSRLYASARLTAAEIARRAAEERRRREEEDRRQQELARQQARSLVELAESLRRQSAAAKATSMVREAPVIRAPTAGPKLTHAQRTAAVREQMLETMKQISAAMAAIPPAVARVHEGRLARIRSALRGIEAARDNNFTMYEPQLRMLRDELARTTADPAGSIERALEAVVALTALRAKLEDRRAQTPPSDASACHTLIERIDDLLAAGDLDLFDGAMEAVRREGRILVDRLDAAASRRLEAGQVRSAIAATLADMGYEVAEMPPALATDADDLVFRSPDDGMVRFHAANELGFEVEYVHLTTNGDEFDAEEFARATGNCRRWCEDARQLRQRLAEAGVDLVIEDELPPDRGGFAVIAAPPAATRRVRDHWDDENETEQERPNDSR